MNYFLIILASLLARISHPQLLPVILPPSSTPQQCEHLNSSIINDHFGTINDHFGTINRYLTDKYGPECGGSGWKNLLSVNMSRDGEQCPQGWNKITQPITACTRGNFRQAAIILSPGGNSYSKVCGRVIAYQVGETDAFKASIENPTSSLGNSYIDGVSLIYRSSNSTQHIWSFAAGASERTSNETNNIRRCPCSVADYSYTL